MRVSKYCGVLIVFTCLLAVISFASLCQAQEQPGQQKVSPQFLFVQSSESFTYAEGKLSLHGVTPYTIYFTDRPVRIAGHVPVNEFIEWGRDTKDSFTEDPPNGTLSIIAGGEAKNIVMVLKDAQLKGDTLSYKISILEGELPNTGGVNSLFIDIIGRPLTPLSFAGANRRARRRAIVYGAGAAAAYGTAASVSAAQPTTVVVNQSSDTAEGKLKELKSMLDSGLITQSEYEDKRKKILADF